MVGWHLAGDEPEGTLRDSTMQALSQLLRFKSVGKGKPLEGLSRELQFSELLLYSGFKNHLVPGSFFRR